jgi:ATP-dependent Lhr-like helicase
MQPLRALTRGRPTRRREPHPRALRSRRLVPPTAEGRWSLVPAVHTSAAGRRRPGVGDDAAARTRWLTAVCHQLLARHGVLTREAVAAETIAGGFGAIYPVLKAMEESGRIRRGYFVAGLGATQFATPGAVDRLRAPREVSGDPTALTLDATDPANPYGATLPWPARATAMGRGPTRSVGATTFAVNGALAAFLARGDRQLFTWLPEAEPDRSRAAQAVATALFARAQMGDEGSTEASSRGAAGVGTLGMLIEDIDGRPPADHPIAPYLIQAGFLRGALGFHAPISRQMVPPPSASPATARSAAARRSIERSAQRRSLVSSPFAFLKHARDTGDD